MLVKQKIKYIQSLGQKKFRDEERLFIAEGPKLVKELLISHPVAVREVYALKDWIEEHQDLLSKNDVIEINEIELERISQLTTPNKVVAVVEQFENSDEIITTNTITLVLDNIQDPGNLGTIIRIADWFGVGQIVCSEHSADCYNSKVVQSTMGSIARVKIYYTDIAVWLAEQKGISIYATDLEGEDIRKLPAINEAIIIIGNESKGISADILALSNKKITIAKKGKAESLNAAVATGIVLSHLR